MAAASLHIAGIQHMSPHCSITMEQTISSTTEQPPAEDVKLSEAILLLGTATSAASEELLPKPKATAAAEMSNNVDSDGSKAEREAFLKDLYDFMELKSHAITKVPSLGFQTLDLYRLYKIVIGRGGMDEVTKQQAWKSVYLELGIPTMSTSASYNTRTNYKKYLYLYELEHFEPEPKAKREDVPFKYAIEDYVKIESAIQEQVYYAQIMKRRFQKGNMYYVHYKGWSNSHDEWMPEYALTQLDGEEAMHKDDLANPPPTRSSKSNYLIFDPSIGSSKASPKKKAKAKASPSMSSNSKKSASSDRMSSLDEWLPTVAEGAAFRSKMASPRAEDLAAALDDLDCAPKRKRAASHRDDEFALDGPDNTLKGLQIAHDHDNYYDAATDDEGPPGHDLELLRAMAAQTLSRVGIEAPGNGRSREQERAADSGKRRRIDLDTLLLPPEETAHRGTRKSALQSRIASVAAAADMATTHGGASRHHRASHFSAACLASSLPFLSSPAPTGSHSRAACSKMSDSSMDDSMDHLREKERAERERFSRLPLKPDEPAITPYNVHSYQLTHDPIHGFLEGVDFEQAIKSIENSSATYRPLGTDRLKICTVSARTSSLDRLSPEHAQGSDPEEASLLEIKASAEAIEKRMEEIKSQYLLCTTRLEELSQRALVQPREPVHVVATGHRDRRK